MDESFRAKVPCEFIMAMDPISTVVEDIGWRRTLSLTDAPFSNAVVHSNLNHHRSGAGAVASSSFAGSEKQEQQEASSSVRKITENTAPLPIP
ncbi:hypothetical protein PIB30_006372 [Stylosanthes scabra]|uniref:Uncharacterized protein n=1 Tax=Stylosanthes scabra TaxID=79078 RepID=A0ABU6S4G4_9FABA|nr:hypothetical protein [Stylosanthes scabra]